MKNICMKCLKVQKLEHSTEISAIVKKESESEINNVAENVPGTAYRYHH
jgi:hypothetical protein